MSLKFEMNLDPEFSDESDYEEDISKDDDSESDIEVIFEKSPNSPKRSSSEIPKKGTWIVRLETLKKCDKCTMFFVNQAELKQHKLEHRNIPKPIKVPLTKDKIQVNEPQLMKTCDFCKQKFPDDQALRDHIKTLHMKVFYESIETATSTKQSISIKTPVPNMKLFGCMPCEKAFSNGAKLKSHLKICRNKENKSTLKTQSKTSIKVGKETRQFRCDKCDKVYPTFSSLVRHQKIKHEKVKIKCDQCDKVFSDISAMRSHIKSTHLKIRYACDICDKLFVIRANLKIHKLSVHDKTYPKKMDFKCEQCKKHFAYRATLKRHYDSVHQKIRHNCNGCEKSFSSRGNLTSHVNRAHMFIKVEK